MTHRDHPGHVTPEIWPARRRASSRPVSAPPRRRIPPNREPRPIVSTGRQVRFTSGGDRRHWELDAWRVNLSRWCSGAPCHLPEVAPGRHWVTLRIWRRSWSARYATPPVPGRPFTDKT